MKLVLYFFIFLGLPISLCAQQHDSVLLTKDSLKSLGIQHVDSVRIKEDSVKLKDSLQLIINHKADSILFIKDSLKHSVIVYKATFNKLLTENRFLNSAGQPFSLVTNIRKKTTQDGMFYAFFILIALLTFLRFFYLRYLNSLFQVFFNTSLRQSQLTDQLLQAKLPSLFFNIISFISEGFFIYFLLIHFGWLTSHNSATIIPVCILAITIIYFIKFLSLKFIGWVTGFTEIANTYIFVIFLINKILGIILIPFVVIIAFSYPDLIRVTAIIALLFIALMFLMRFFRSYGLLQHQLKFNRLHFYMYIFGVEILPVLLIYKGLVLLLSKNL